ncbi:hypothetical protein [Prevotella pallens]|uniref:hypothetical protein n=1 Tax=Prevotella pallens TaxID=60133 RepID=UPI0028E9F9C5|nr:hypothetical protein [Prevotella pallens]
MGHLIDFIPILLSFFVCYYAGKYKAYSNIYEKVLNEHVKDILKKNLKTILKTK